MSTEVAKFDQNNLPAELAEYFDPTGMGDDLSAGVAGGFAILSFRGSKWRIKSAGEETLITGADGEVKPSVELVFLKASPDVSKVYYDHNYVEGSDEPPTCMSVNGITPDADSSTPQAPSCAACPHNQWGSRMTEAGKKAKACQDSRRIAVVPMGDIPNEQYGGAMLLRVPAASLNDLKTYGLGMKNKGFPYNTIITKVGFDPDASYPKLTFRPVRRINQEEAVQIVDHMKAERVETILTQADESRAQRAIAAQTAPAPAPAPKVDTVSLEFEEDAPAAASVPAAAAAQVATAPTEVADPAPVATAPAAAQVDDALSGELDDILSQLETG